MNMSFRISLFLSIGLISSSVMAAQFPKGCEVSGFVWHDRYLVLNESGKQSFYLLQNKSSGIVELNREEEQPVFMSPKLSAKIASSQWAGFSADEHRVYFACFNRAANQLTPVVCSEVLDVCQYPRAKFALSNMGTYWVSVNKAQQQVIRDAAAKGIYLRW